MGRIVEIAYGKDIVKYVSNIVSEKGGKDFSDFVIVFPGKRPSLYVRKYLFAKIKTGFIPPILLSMDGFIEKSYGGDLKLVKYDVNLIWMLYDSIRDDLTKYGYNAEFEEFMPWGYKIASLIEELDIEDVSVEGKYYYPEDLPGYIEKVIINFGKIRERFHDYIIKKGYITRGMMYREVARRADYGWMKNKHLIFAGFFALTKSENEIVRKLLKKDNVSYVVQREREEWNHFKRTVDEWKKDENVEYVGNSETTPEAVIKITSAFDSHSEIVGIANILSHTEDKENCAIVLPEPSQLFPLLNIVMDGVNIPYNITMGYPVVRSPLYSMFNIIFRLQENRKGKKYYVGDFIKLLYHPYVKNIKFGERESFARSIFEIVRTEIKNKRLYFVEKDDIGKLISDERREKLLLSEDFSSYTSTDIQELFDTVFTVFIEPFSSIKSLAELSRAIESVLRFIHEKSLFENYLLNKKFVTKFLEIIDSVKKGEIASENLGGETVFNIFRKMCEHENVPFVGSPLRPFQIMGLLETRNLRHERVILADVNEGILPADDINDPLIPHGLRKVLKLPTYESGLEIYKYYFNRILKTSKFVELLYVKNDQNERSRFIEELLWKGEKRNAGKHGYELKEIKFKVGIEKEDDSGIRKSDEIMEFLSSMEFSPSTIDLYMNCPYRFYLGEILKIEEEKNPEEFDNRDIGIFMHRTLEKLFKNGGFVNLLREYGIDKGLKNEILKHTDESIENEFAEIIGEKKGEKLILFEIAKKAIENYIISFADTIDEDFSVISTEMRLTGNIISDNRNIKLKGFADRIDKIGNSIVINDYKTGSNIKVPNTEKIDELDMENLSREAIKKSFCSVQLPMYVYLYNQMNPDYDFESIDARLILLREKLKKDRIKSLFKTKKNGKTDKREFIENRFVSVLRFLIGEILDRDVNFVPDRSNKHYCNYCPYKKLCK